MKLLSFTDGRVDFRKIKEQFNAFVPLKMIKNNGSFIPRLCEIKTVKTTSDTMDTQHK